MFRKKSLFVLFKPLSIQTAVAIYLKAPREARVAIIRPLKTRKSPNHLEGTKQTPDLRKPTDLADEFANHAVPGAVGQRRSVLPVSHLVHVVLEAQDLGQGVQDVDGEAFVRLGLAQNVLRHHHERLLLPQPSEGDQPPKTSQYFIN